MQFKRLRLRMPKIKSVGMFSSGSTPMQLWSKEQREAYIRKVSKPDPDLILSDSHADTPDITGEELLTIIDENLRGYSPCIREDLRSEIALAILNKASITRTRITATNLNLTRLNIRQIAKSVYKIMPDKFRDVSLDYRHANSDHRVSDRIAA